MMTLFTVTLFVYLIRKFICVVVLKMKSIHSSVLREMLPSVFIHYYFIIEVMWNEIIFCSCHLPNKIILLV